MSRSTRKQCLPLRTPATMSNLTPRLTRDPRVAVDRGKSLIERHDQKTGQPCLSTSFDVGFAPVAIWSHNVERWVTSVTAYAARTPQYAFIRKLVAILDRYDYRRREIAQATRVIDDAWDKQLLARYSRVHESGPVGPFDAIRVALRRID